MLVQEKTHHIDLKMHGHGLDIVIEAIKEKYPRIRVTNDDDDYVNIEDTEYWKETEKYTTPAKALRVYRDNAGLSLTKLSELTGIAKSHLSEMEHGKRTIGVKAAKILGKTLKCNYLRFL